MLNLSRQSLKNTDQWKEAGIEVPGFDLEKLSSVTAENPKWIHIGAGNLFRAFIAVLQQTLLNSGRTDTGIVAVAPHDHENIDRVFKPHDNLTLLVIMNPDGTLVKKVIGSVSDTLVGDPAYKADWERLKNMFKKPSLQMVSMTITEKSYSLKKISGEYFDDVAQDMANGPEKPKNIISKIAALAYTRYKNGKLPIAFFSLDNVSRNGEKLGNSVVEIVGRWVENKLVDSGFLEYINDRSKVAFPWTVIDKITPGPSETVAKALNSIGFGSTEIICTPKKTLIAPFVNAEAPQYLVVEDSFPNGRMPLEAAGVYFTDRDTVDRVEKMKVCTCLNPLHTALAVYGCILGYKLIADEMKNPLLKKLVEKIAYDEGLPVVVDPGILKPEAFVREVIEQRFPNPYIPDTPQRIATDTSRKIGVRYGETIKAYKRHANLDPKDLKYIPLAIAGWLRYLMGVDDNGEAFALNPDPMMEILKSAMSGIEFGKPESVGDSLKPILSNESLFGVDLCEAGLGDKITGYFKELIAGKNAVTGTLEKYLG